ncbi:hypothetical protein F2Q68_00020376, partial [Brassica cretica]
TFKLSLQFSEDYPNKPPTCWCCGYDHPWLNNLSFSSFFFKSQSLLCDPNPNSPANLEAARMFSESKREYNRRFREVVEQSWTAD